MPFKNAVLDSFIIPADAADDDAAIIITSETGLPACLATDYNAAVLWRPSGNLSFDVPYWILAANANDSGSVDELFLQYNPSEGLCRWWKVGAREAGVFGGDTLDMLYEFGPDVNTLPVEFTTYQMTTVFGPNHELQIGSSFTVGDTSRLIVAGDVIHDHGGEAAGTETLINGSIALAANSFGVGCEFDEVTTLFTDTSTTYTTTGGTVVGTAFRMPMMGAVDITCSARVGNNTLNVSSYVSPQVREGATIGSGTVVFANSDNYSCEYNGVANGAVVSSFTFRFEGNPGDEYNVRLLHRVGAASTGSYGRRKIVVRPALTSYY